MMCSTWGQVYLNIKHLLCIVPAATTERSPVMHWNQSRRHGASHAIFLPFACLLEDGHIHRAVRIGAQLSVLEDLALFPEPQPVDSMKLYHVSCESEEPGRGRTESVASHGPAWKM